MHLHGGAARAHRLARELSERDAAAALEEATHLVQPVERLLQLQQLVLADLGGSEQIKKSKASGERLQEAVNINLGLLALKNVIVALHQRRPYVPYQVKPCLHPAPRTLALRGFCRSVAS